MKTLIFMPNWMGDFIMALSVILRMEPGRREHTTLLAPQWLAPLSRTLSRLTAIDYDRERADRRRLALRAVREREFDKVCLLPYSFSSAWFAFRAGIHSRRGLAKDGRGFLLTERLPRSARDYTRHITYEYASVLETEPAPPHGWEGLPIAADEKYRGYIAVCPGATFGPAKQWPYFSRLIELLNGERIVLLGRVGDSSGIETAARGNGGIVDLTGRTSLPQAAAIIAAARAVVANDSGLMHLAGFLGTPVVGIFGSTSPDWTRPLGKRSVVLYNRRPCSPCFRPTCRYGHYECLRSVQTQNVAHTLAGVMS